jgi:hypothetical protein
VLLPPLAWMSAASLVHVTVPALLMVRPFKDCCSSAILSA